ncbi:MAG TPA: adenylate/guanylate cyclase domain-containing protein [Actinomycetota bacterium]|jgi:class 3 adenylate cyclase
MAHSPERLEARQLAERSGVDVETIHRYTSLGFLAPEDGTYSANDVARVRLVGSCDRAGLPLEGIAEAVERGMLSFAFLDMAQYRRFGDFGDRTYGQVAAEAGVTFEFVQRTLEATGLPVPESEDDRLRENDELLIRVLSITRAFGTSEEAVLRVTRVYGDSLRRITEAENTFYRNQIEQPVVDSGIPLGQAMAAASQFGNQWNTAGDQSIMALYHRHQESVWIGGLVARIEEALEQLGVHERLTRPPAMVFLDLAGYTRLTEERGDTVAAELATELSGITQTTSQQHGGRPVKWLGDGIMFHFPDPRRSVAAALEMVERTPRAGLPPAHVGIAAGPVVQQDGDYFGRTVNMAARISSRAAPEEVLVTDEVVRLAEPDGVRFEPIGEAELRGFSDPVTLHRAARG